MKDYHHYKLSSRERNGSPGLMVAINCQKTVDTIPKLRRYLLPKFQSDISKLPTTVVALKFKIFHTNFIALALHRVCWSFQRLLLFKNYGWEIGQDKTMAIMTDKLQAPLALMRLSVCNCTFLCNNNRCKWYKNNLSRTDISKYISCHNERESENFEVETKKAMNKIQPKKNTSKNYLFFVCFKNRFNII